MSRVIVPLNREWKYNEVFNESYIQKDFDDHNFQTIAIPHMNKEIPYNYFDEKMYQFVSCYRKHFTLEDTFINKRVFVDFEGVMTYAKVYINGVCVGEHKGGYTPFSFDITDYVSYEKENILVVMVDSTEREDIPPFGNVIDYLTYGGIYREVNLRIVEDIHINNFFVKPQKVLEEEKEIHTNIHISNNAAKGELIEVELQLCEKDGPVISEASKNIEITEKKQIVNIELIGLKNIKLWDIENPNLYDVKVLLYKNNQVLDVYEVKTGFRTAEFTADGFFLNGKSLKIRGLNRHQAFPYVGYAMPKRAQEKDADILKYDLRLNTVRTSHYPQSKHFLNRCDEIGLLVFEEIPGWQHIGDKAWQKVACENVKEMIIRDWNHPSIILWGVRINESADNHDFYLETNKIAHELDNTRQTGGVRCINNSELFEDVYTMNDFVCGSGDNRKLKPQQEITGLDKNVPYLVTEFNGHMYPTKRFDQEERLNEHALRHLEVQNAAALDPHKCGAIGWCAFDYNTHYQFGSGDRICYHGVMDMFRIPKFASFMYKSQVSPEKEVVMEPVTRYARGERSIGDIAPLTIFTNCDKVAYCVGGIKNGEYYPCIDRYAGVEYPPVIIDKIDGEWGMGWQDAEFVGYINDKEVIRKKYVKDPVPTRLIVDVDNTKLNAGEMDTTRLIFKVIDQAGNEMPYIDEIVTVEIEGPGSIIGPSQFSLIGGCRGAWIKTNGEAGEIIIKAKCTRLEADNITILVEK